MNARIFQRRFLIVVLLAVALISGLAITGAASAQETQLVCYLSGLNWVGDPILPNGSVATSEIYYADGTLFTVRTVTMQSSQYGLNWGLLPIFAPRGGFELIYIDYPPGNFLLGGFFVDDWIRPVDECAVARIGDGRINDGGAELGAPLAAYCDENAGISVWDIAEDGAGNKVFAVTGEDIAVALAEALESGIPVLIGEGAGNQIWASPDDYLAVLGPDIFEAGKTYRFDFPADTCGTVEAPQIVKPDPVVIPANLTFAVQSTAPVAPPSP